MTERRSSHQPERSDLGVLASTERFMKESLKAANVAMWNISPETGETWFSDIWYTSLGYDPGAFEPSFDVFLEMMHPDDHAPTIKAFNALVAGATDVYRADFRLRAADGSWRWFGSSGAKIDRSREGQPYLVCGMQLDISWRKGIEQQLEQTAYDAKVAKERLTVLADNSPASLFEFRIGSDGAVSFPYITAGVLELLAVDQGDVDFDGAAVFQNIHEEDLPAVQAAIEESMSDLTRFHVRYRVKLPDGKMRWIQANSVPKRLGDGGTTWFGSIYDVSKEVEHEGALAAARDEAVALQGQMRDLALLDVLTGLPNRRNFDEHLKARGRLDDAKTDAPKAVLIRVDLDRFKNVNDTLGHEAGDAVLRYVAEVLTEAVSAEDLAARTGGDEFSIVLAPGSRVTDAKRIVKRIQKELIAPFKFDGKVCRFGASFGIATTDNGSISSGDLMSFADAALYRSKQRGRNRVEVFDKGLHKAIIDSRRLASEIEAGLENQEFEPFFQPQVNAVTGELTGLEVLARWRSKDHGVLAPDRFLPVAEQIRVVSLIDKAMVERTTDIVKSWQASGFCPPKLGFNISSDRLRETGIIEAVDDLRLMGLRISFELLESILLEEQETFVRQHLEQIKQSGIELEVDDFGSGHASIVGLLEIRPSTLKIDTRLARTVQEDKTSRELIRSVVGIARALNIRTTAEGVETSEQMMIMRELGCDNIQGYLFSKPLDAGSMLAWAANREDQPIQDSA